MTIDPNLARTIRALPEALLPLSGTEVTAISQTNPDFPILSAIPFRTVQIDLTDLPGGGGGISGPPDQVLYFGALGSVTSDALFVRDPSTFVSNIGVPVGINNLQANLVVGQTLNVGGGSIISSTGSTMYDDTNTILNFMVTGDFSNLGLGSHVNGLGMINTSTGASAVLALGDINGPGTQGLVINMDDGSNNQTSVQILPDQYSANSSQGAIHSGIEILYDRLQFTVSNTNWLWPTTDGTTGQALTTDGAGNLTFTTVGGGGLPSGSQYQILTLNGGGPTAAWSNVLYGGEGATAINLSAGTRNLLDDIGNVALDWQTYAANSKDGGVSIAWDARSLDDATGISAVNWGNRITLDTLGATSINWQNRRLSDTSSVTLDWGARLFYDAGGDVATQWNVGSTVIGDVNHATTSTVLTVDTANSQVRHSGLHTTFSSITFTGGGLNDFSFAGGYANNTSSTYSVTIDSTNNLSFGAGAPGGGAAPSNGDTFTSSSGGTGFVSVFDSGGNTLYVVVTSGTVLNGDTITDTTTGWHCIAATPIAAPDTFSWTNSLGSSGHYTLILAYPTSQGMVYNINAAFTAQTGHTLNDNWSFSATVGVASLLLSNFYPGTFNVTLGDVNNVGNSTVLVVDDLNERLIFNKPLTVLNNINYFWPSSEGAGTVLTNNGSGVLTWEAPTSGTYTPTPGNLSNITGSVNMSTAFWSRVGLIVTVSGLFDCTVATLTTLDGGFTIDLPYGILTGNGQCGGTISGLSNGPACSGVVATASYPGPTYLATLQFVANTAGDVAYGYTFQYIAS